jgi:hypothetical protein
MQVTVESNLHISNIFEPPLTLDLEGRSPVLRDALQELANRCRSVQFVQDDGRAGDDVNNILLNGNDYYSLAQGLNTPLQQNDMISVEIYMDPLGGG